MQQRIRTYVRSRSFVKNFDDVYHWHTLKKLTDEYDRIPDRSQHGTGKVDLVEFGGLFLTLTW